MRLLRLWFAKFLQKRMMKQLAKNFELDKPKADKWNHLYSVIMCKGNIKLDWDKILQRPVVKCSKCLIVIRRGEYGKEICEKCKQEVTKSKRGRTRKRSKL